MAPSFLDVRLDWLIAQSGIEHGDAFRRLNAIENQLANLASQWRAWRPIDPAREVRMCEATRDQLVMWIGEVASDSIHVLERLVIYHSKAVLDNAVPEGWVRLVLNE